MKKNVHHKARILVLLAALNGLAPGLAAAAEAGRVGFVSGQVIASTAGKDRVLTKGDAINEGDVIDTRAGRAQLRFSDGGFVSLQPGTQFRVDEYQYNGKTDGSEKSSFSFLKGAMRAITGMIGRVNKDNYKVRTAAATIGIRGTGYTGQSDGTDLRAAVFQGSIFLLNNKGELIVDRGRAAYVRNVESIPVLTFDRPSASPTPTNRVAQERRQNRVAGEETGQVTGFVDSDVIANNGIIQSLINDISRETGLSASDLGSSPINQIGSQLTDSGDLDSGNLGGTVNEAGQFVSDNVTTITGNALRFVEIYSGHRNQVGGSDYGTQNRAMINSNKWWPWNLSNWNANVTAKYANAGSANLQNQPPVEFTFSGGYLLNVGTDQITGYGRDETIAWGKWVNGTNFFTCDGCHINTDLSGNSGNAYVVGLPTASMPVGKGTYTLLGAPSPSATSGTSAWSGGSVTSGSLDVNFDSLRVDARLALRFPNMTGGAGIYNINANGLPISGAFFSGIGNYTTASGGAAADCTDGCVTDIQGFFAGSDAVRAGLGYVFYSKKLDEAFGSVPYNQSMEVAYGAPQQATVINGQYNGIGGTAAFTQNDSGTGNSNLIMVGASSTSIATWDSYLGDADTARVYFSASLGNKPTMVDIMNGSSVADSFSRGSSYIGLDGGADSVVGWGRWYGGVASSSDGDIDVSAANAALHIAYGTAPTNMPATGTATYNFLGATIPSADNPAANYTGGSVTGGSLGVNFDSATVAVNNLTLSFPSLGQSMVSGNSAGTYTINANSLAISGTGFAGSGSALGVMGTGGNSQTICASCATQITGFFAGDAASRAGLSYNIDSPHVLDSSANVNIQGVAAFTKALNP